MKKYCKVMQLESILNEAYLNNFYTPEKSIK